MSAALSHASRLKPDIRLAQAISEFKANLSNDQKITLNTYESQSRSSQPELSDVMQFTAELDRRASGNIGRKCFGPRLTNFLQAIQQYAALGDVVIGGSQNILACGIWALARMTLLAAVNFTSYFDKMSTLLMEIGRSAPRYQTLALIYAQSKSLRSSFSEYFIIVVRLCHIMVLFTQKSVPKQIASSLSDADVKTIRSDLEVWASAIREEVGVLMARRIEEEARENSRFRALSRKRFSSSILERRLENKLRILNHCSSYDHATTWKQIRKMGTTNHFASSNEYQDWKQRKTSCTLLYTGKLGAGKSVLMANIVDDLNLHISGQPASVAYFFCKHDIEESLKARTVIGSLAQQLLRHNAVSMPGAETSDEIQSHLNTKTIVRLVQASFPKSVRIYLVLDGLDDLNESEKTTLFLQLIELQKTHIVLACISHRTGSDDASHRLQTVLKNSVVTKLPEANPEIQDFIDRELHLCLETGKLVLGDPSLILAIRDALFKDSQGMFLWTNLQIQSLCSMNSDKAIRDALVRLPQSLGETYARILQQASGKRQIEERRRILKLITASFRPLTVEELREALSVVPGDTTWDPERLPTEMLSTLTCCGPLLTIDEEEKTLRLVHSSFKQFLIDEPELSRDKFPLISAHDDIFKCIVTYLSYGVFDTQLSSTVIPQGSLQSAPSNILRSTLAPSYVRNMAIKLLKARKTPNYDTGKIFVEGRKLASPWAHQTDFQFYNYAHTFWFHHALECRGLENSLYSRLALLLIRELKVKIDTRDEYGRNLLSLSAMKGADWAVELLFNSGMVQSQVEECDNLNRTALSWAAHNGHSYIVNRLLKRTISHPDADRKDIFGETPLLSATKNGHADVVRTLTHPSQISLHKITSNTHIPSRDGYTPLGLACRAGDVAIAHILLSEANVDPNLAGPAHRTPLILAAMEGHEDIVKLLLTVSSEAVDTNVFDEDQCLALTWAARNGHARIVKMLLDFPGTRYSQPKDKQGRTPLAWAADGGHTEIVHMFLRGEEGFNVDSLDLGQCTPLSLAAQTGHTDIVRALLDAKGERLDTSPLTGVAMRNLAPPYDREMVKMLEDYFGLKAKKDLDRFLHDD